MHKAQSGNGLLSGFRALDLADEKGFLCGSILGGLGVDVIKIERPGGDPSRHRGPFYHDMPDAEKSLYWFAYNTNKRGVTLNLDAGDGQEIFKTLARIADFVIESFSPGYMDTLGLGYPVLSKLNPRVILTSITPFGQTGPYKDYKASDLVAMAMGGLLYMTGDSDRPPVRVSVPQSYALGGAYAAAGTMIAHHHRELTGEGQQVDVSLQEAVACNLIVNLPFWQFAGYITPRLGNLVHRGKGIYQRETWSCKDGQIGFRVFTGIYGRGVRPLAEWMDEEGVAGPLKEVKDWEKIDVTKMSQKEMDGWEKAFSNFFRNHTMAELQEEAGKRHIYLGRFNTPKSILEDEQLAKRKYWPRVRHPELGATITYPGAPYKFTETEWKIKRRAPLIGEHNDEVYSQELGLSKRKLTSLKKAGII